MRVWGVLPVFQWRRAKILLAPFFHFDRWFILVLLVSAGSASFFLQQEYLKLNFNVNNCKQGLNYSLSVLLLKKFF